MANRGGTPSGKLPVTSHKTRQEQRIEAAGKRETARREGNQGSSGKKR